MPGSEPINFIKLLLKEASIPLKFKTKGIPDILHPYVLRDSTQKICGISGGLNSKYKNNVNNIQQILAKTELCEENLVQFAQPEALFFEQTNAFVFLVRNKLIFIQSDANHPLIEQIKKKEDFKKWLCPLPTSLIHKDELSIPLEEDDCKLWMQPAKVTENQKRNAASALVVDSVTNPLINGAGL